MLLLLLAQDMGSWAYSLPERRRVRIAPARHNYYAGLAGSGVGVGV